VITRLLFLTLVGSCVWVSGSPGEPGEPGQPVTLSQALIGALERDPTFMMERSGAERGLIEAEQAERGFLSRASLKSAGGSYWVSEFGDRSEATATANLQVPGAAGSSVSVEARHSFSLTSSDSVEEMYAHDPRLSVTWRQSLVGGALPGAALARAARSKPAALRAGALVSLDEARNGAVLRTARLYYGVAEQRRRVELAAARLAERRADAENLERTSSMRLGGQQEAQRLWLSVREEELGQNRELNLCLHLEGMEDILSLNATNTKILIEAFGKESENWLNKSIKVGLVKVDFQGKLVDGIQVSV